MSANRAIIVGDGRLTDRDQRDYTTSRDTVAVVERRPHGERVVLDRSGVVHVVDPYLWRRGRRLVDWIDANLGPQVVRDDPLPPSPALTAAALRARPGILVVTMVLLGLAGLVLLFAALSSPEDWLFPLVFGVLFLGSEVLWWRLLSYTRRLQRRAGVRADPSASVQSLAR